MPMEELKISESDIKEVPFFLFEIDNIRYGLLPKYVDSFVTAFGVSVTLYNVFAIQYFDDEKTVYTSRGLRFSAVVEPIALVMKMREYVAKSATLKNNNVSKDIQTALEKVKDKSVSDLVVTLFRMGGEEAMWEYFKVSHGLFNKGK